MERRGQKGALEDACGTAVHVSYPVSAEETMSPHMLQVTNTSAAVTHTQLFVTFIITTFGPALPSTQTLDPAYDTTATTFNNGLLHLHTALARAKHPPAPAGPGHARSQPGQKPQKPQQCTFTGCMLA